MELEAYTHACRSAISLSDCWNYKCMLKLFGCVHVSDPELVNSLFLVQSCFSSSLYSSISHFLFCSFSACWYPAVVVFCHRYRCMWREREAARGSSRGVCDFIHSVPFLLSLSPPLSCFSPWLLFLSLHVSISLFILSHCSHCSHVCSASCR